MQPYTSEINTLLCCSFKPQQNAIKFLVMLSQDVKKARGIYEVAIVIFMKNTSPLTYDVTMLLKYFYIFS